MLKKIRSEKILIIVLALVLITIISIIVYITYHSQRVNKKTIEDQKVPAQHTTVLPTRAIIYKPTAQSQTRSIYDNKAQDILLEKIQNRKILSESDNRVKVKIINLLPEGKKSGNLYKSPNVNIEYINTPNIFQVEIVTANIVQAKDEAVAWFVDQGFSQDAICNYPVEFYLNYKIKQELSNTGVLFSPLAPNCQ